MLRLSGIFDENDIMPEQPFPATRTVRIDLPAYNLKGHNSRKVDHFTPADAIEAGFITLEQLREYDCYAFLRDPEQRFLAVRAAMQQNRDGRIATMQNPCGHIPPPQYDFFHVNGEQVVTPLDFDDYENEIRMLIEKLGGYKHMDVAQITQSHNNIKMPVTPVTFEPKHHAKDIVLYRELVRHRRVMQVRDHGKKRLEHLEQAFRSAPKTGHVLEFGVGGGQSMRWLAKLVDRTMLIHGFDTFEGLPEPWVMNTAEGLVVPAGSFKYDPPNIHGVRYHIGLFKDTIKQWRTRYPGMIAFIHIDSDLYSSCVTVLEELNKQIVPGTVIVFDEMYETVMYKDWQEGEYKAFQEWQKTYNRKVYELGRTEYGESSYRILE
jgi:predicted O-methyltransferase YrrM